MWLFTTCWSLHFLQLFMIKMLDVNLKVYKGIHNFKNTLREHPRPNKKYAAPCGAVSLTHAALESESWLPCSVRACGVRPGPRSPPWCRPAAPLRSPRGTAGSPCTAPPWCSPGSTCRWPCCKGGPESPLGIGRNGFGCSCTLRGKGRETSRGKTFSPEHPSSGYRHLGWGWIIMTTPHTSPRGARSPAEQHLGVTSLPNLIRSSQHPD